MGVKAKRKVTKPDNEDNSEYSTSCEPPEKKIRHFSGEDFVQALRGREAAGALKQWLYLISNQREQAQMDKESSPAETQQTNSNLIEVDIKGKHDDSEKGSVQQCGPEDEDIEIDSCIDKDSDEDGSLKHIDSFLQAGGCTSDIVNLLPEPENAQVSQLRHVFRALSKVLLRISSEHPDKVSEAVNVCRDLISSYSRHINDMLKIQRSLRERILNLELLTAMVALDSKFAKEILNSISLEADVVEQLTSTRSSVHVRIAYIKFLVALLIDADNSLIIAVVNKPWMLLSIMEGLQYDPSEIVVLLLMTVKKTILENKSVPKSSKQIIFNTDGIISLLHLYKWKGPQNRPKSLTFWAMKKMSSKPKLMAEIDGAEAEHVASAIHDLLIVLLTNHRYGIIFRDTSVAHQSDRHNKMVSRVLQRIGHPWENSKVAGLVSKILAACPDSLRPTLASIESFIEPRPSSQWFHCISFLKQVLEDQSPEEVLQRQISRLTMSQLGAAAIEMCIPASIIRPLNSNEAEALHSEDFSVVKCTVSLLVTMLKKSCTFVDVVRRWATNGILSHAQFTSFRRHITEHLLKHVPKVNSIQKAWLLWSDKFLNSSGGELSDNSAQEYFEILFLLLELLEMYQQLCPAVLDPLRSTHSDLKSYMTTTVLQAPSSDNVGLLRNRLFQLLLDVNDESFSLENSEMEESISLMMKDLLSLNPTVRSMALSVLQSLIRRVGTLEGSPQEAGVWLSAFQETFLGKEESCREVASILIESMTLVCTSCSKYLDILAESEEEAAKSIREQGELTCSQIDSIALQELFDDAAENFDFLESSLHPFQINVATLSPWVPAFLEALQEFFHQKKPKKKSKKVVEEFCCKLLLRLLYRLPQPATLIHLILQSYLDIIPSELAHYLQSWLPGKDPMAVEQNIMGEDSLEVQLSLFLFDENNLHSLKNDIHKLFLRLALPTTEKDVEDISDEKKSKAITQILQMVYFTCFHVTQFAQSGKLTGQFVEKCQKILFSIFDAAVLVDKVRAQGQRQEIFTECFKVILSHPLLLLQFNPLAKHSSESSFHLTKLTIAVAKTALSSSALHIFLIPFKEKLLSSLQVALKKKKNCKEDPVCIIDAFPLKFEEISNLLSVISNLPKSSMVVGNDPDLKLSHWWYLSVHLLSRISALRMEGSSPVDKVILPSSIVTEISNRLLELLGNESLDLSSMFEAFLSYIYTCPQQTIHIPVLLLPRLMCAKNINSASCKLAVWLATCSESNTLFEVLKSTIKGHSRSIEHLSMILPVLRVALKKGEEKGIKKSVMAPVYEQVKTKIRDSVISLADHPEWLTSNADVIVLLMKRFMKSDVRESLCKSLEKKAPALTQEKLYYLQLVAEALREKPPQFLLLLLAWLGVFLKKHGDSVNQVTSVKLLCHNILNILKEDTNEKFAVVKESKVWQETLRLALKFGLGITDLTKEEDDDVEGDGENNASDTSCLLLQTLASLCNRMYSSGEEHEHIAMVHSMTLQHSSFLNIMMGSSPVKYELVQLLHVLLGLSPKIMDSSHVPVFLAAYNASTSKTDRALLRVLILFERSGIDLSHCRPYFWGRQGASHYSIWSHNTKNSRTLFQQPRPDQVLGLLDTNMVLKTISNYPLCSTLNLEENMEVPVDGVYDPAFFLPLFIYLLSPESPVLTHMFVRTGALALTLSSLSSYDVDVRAAAYTCLSRFVAHLQMARGRNKDLFLHFMSALQKGLSAYDEENPRVPSLVTVFLAHCALELGNPQSPMYKPLMNFVLAKPAMNLRAIPEFMPLLHSDHVEHIAHRHWILKVLCEGLRAPYDVVLGMEVVAFKLLPSFYSSCLSDFKSRVYILGCLQSAIGVQYGACCLIRDYSLTSWLHQAILSLNPEDYSLISEMVRLLCTLWNSLSLPSEGKLDSETGRSVPHIERPASKALRLLLALLPKLTPQIGIDTMSQYVSVLCDLVAALTSSEISAFTSDILKSLFKVSSTYCSNMREFYDLLELGCDFVDNEILSSSKTSEVNKLRLKLRSLTIKWITLNKKVKKEKMSE